jgi:AraC-like DNA-binding protein
MKRVNERALVDAPLGERRFVLPKALAEEALSGGFSSLWLPLELGYRSSALGFHRAIESGEKFLTIGFCQYGQGWFEYGKTRYNLSKNSIWIALPGIPYAFGSEAGQRFDFYWLKATGSRIAWFRNLLPREGGLPVFPAGDAFKLRCGLEDLFALLEGALTKNLLDRASLLLGYILSDLHQGPTGASEAQTPLDQRMERMLERLDARLGETIKVDELAAFCNVTPAYFAARFRRLTGYRFAEYLIRRKMARAQELLETSDLPVKEIALDLAYTDQLYFSRSFKRIVGCSPLAWRNRERSSMP